MYNSKNVIYEDNEFWILKTKFRYELYKKGATCSKRIGFVSLSLGLSQAIKVIDVLHKK